MSNESVPGPKTTPTPASILSGSTLSPISIVETASSLPLPIAAPEAIKREIGSVRIIYNHYKDLFPLTTTKQIAQDQDSEEKEGSLDLDLIDEKYAFNFVNKGHYQLHFCNLDGSPFKSAMKGDSGFPSLDGFSISNSYIVQVEKDELASTPAKSCVLLASDLGKLNINGGKQASKTNAADIITQELKGMTREELEEKGERYRSLIEARELESCLYGN